MYKLTVFNPNGSVADVLLIPDTLAIELTNVLENSNRESLDLALLREIKLRALSVVFRTLKEQNIKTNNPQDIQDFAICTLDWFGSLLDVILLIEELPNPNSLCICLSK